MSEKHLAELPWKTLVTKLKIKDPGLGKALAGLQQGEGSDAAERMRLLDVVARQANAIKAEQKGLKEIVTYLDEMLKEVAKVRGVLKLQAGSGTEKGEEPVGAEEDEDDAKVEQYQKSVKGTLLAALSKVKSSGAETKPGQEPPPPQQFIAYLAGADCAVLVARSVGSLRTLLPQLVGGVSGGKYVQGSCIFEKGAHTFVVESVPGGLAAALSKGLQALTGTKFKVRVRSADGSTADEAGEDQEAEGDSDATPAARFQARRQGIEEAYLASLRPDSPDAGKIRALLAYVDGAAETGDLAKATVALDKLEEILASTASAGMDPAFLQKWDEACTGVRGLLRQIQEAVAKSDDFNARPAILCLQSVSKNLAHRPASPQEINELENWIAKDDVITLIETPNPFGISIKIRDTLLPVLGRWKEEMPA